MYAWYVVWTCVSTLYVMQCTLFVWRDNPTFTRIFTYLTICNFNMSFILKQKISMVTLCNGDMDRPLKIEVFDWEKSGKHVFMGLVNVSVRDLINSNGE